MNYHTDKQMVSITFLFSLNGSELHTKIDVKRRKLSILHITVTQHI